MARRNDRNMKQRLRLLMVLGCIAAVSASAQEDAYLAKLTEGVKQIRQEKASKTTLNQTVINWSANDCPKITLMDEIKDPANEYRGNDVKKFKINQIVTYVYSRQNTGMVSKGDYFNSTEKDVYYSAIEKTIVRKRTANYTLAGHKGRQEFVFVSFNPKATFKVTVNGMEAEAIGTGVRRLILPDVKPSQEINIRIENLSNSNESFVILNHNSQKQ